MATINGNNDVNDILNGTSGSDVINGLSGNDSLNGGLGDDTLLGGLGDDTLVGSNGTNYLDGGTGTDTVVLRGSPSEYTFMSAGSYIYVGDKVANRDGLNRWTNIEQISFFNGSAPQSLASLKIPSALCYIASHTDLMNAFGANEQAGADHYLTWGYGEGRTISFDPLKYIAMDRNRMQSYGANVNANAKAAATDYINAYLQSTPRVLPTIDTSLAVQVGDTNPQDQNDLLIGTNGNDALFGQAGDDNLSGGNGDDKLSGGDGNDNIVGGAGNDEISGGIGNDTINYFAASSAVQADLNTGVATTLNNGVMETDRFVSIENVNGSAYHDSLTGDGNANRLLGLVGNDTLTGNAGNDTLDGGAGDDTLDGGAGTDTVVLSGSLANYTFIRHKGVIYVGDRRNGSADRISLWNNIELVRFGDAPSMNLLAIAIPGILLYIAMNRDLMEMYGADADAGLTHYITKGRFESRPAIDTSLAVQVDFGGGQTINGYDGNDALFGQGGDDTLIGRAGNDKLSGGEGNDVIDGGTGWDQISGGAGTDTLTYAAASTGVHADLSTFGSTTWNNGAMECDGISGIENLVGSRFGDTLTGDANANSLLGLTGNDTLNGNAGHDTLDGGTGADLMRGGADHDVYVVDDAGDIVDDTNGAGADAGDTDEVRSSVTFDLSGTQVTVGSLVTNLTLTGTGNINGTGTDAIRNVIIGNSGNNVLDGLGGNDVLDGGGGADLLRGGADDDVYFIDHADDIVDETNGAGDDAGGIDEVRSSVTFDLSGAQAIIGSLVENLTLTGVDDINGTGTNASGNVIIGNEGDNVLNGLGGNDVLYGGGGNDTLIGGEGYYDLAEFTGALSEYVITAQAGGDFTMANDTNTTTLRGIEAVRFRFAIFMLPRNATPGSVVQLQTAQSAGALLAATMPLFQSSQSGAATGGLRTNDPQPGAALFGASMS